MRAETAAALAGADAVLTEIRRIEADREAAAAVAWLDEDFEERWRSGRPSSRSSADPSGVRSVYVRPMIERFPDIECLAVETGPLDIYAYRDLPDDVDHASCLTGSMLGEYWGPPNPWPVERRPRSLQGAHAALQVVDEHIGYVGPRPMSFLSWDPAPTAAGLEQWSTAVAVAAEGIEALRPAILAVARSLGQWYDEATKPLVDAGLLPDGPPDDVRGRALWLAQHRSTGPDNAPVTERRRPRRSVSRR